VTAALFGLCLGLLPGCRSDPERPAATPRGWLSEELGEGIRPTLEEVFLEPPILGTPPLIQTLSPDGRFLLVRWSEEPDEEAGEPDARLVDLDDPEGAQGRGWRVADLLPPPDEEAAVEGEEEASSPELGPLVWSHRGHELAVARGANIYLIDPQTREAYPFLAARAREEEAEEDAGNSEENGGGSARLVEKRIKSLAFAPADDALRFADEKELYSLPFAGLPERAYSLEEATWWSEEIDPPALRVRWSLDLGVCFGEDPTPLEPEPDEDAVEGGEESAESSELPVYQVYHLDEDRPVSLAGMQDEQWLERMAISEDGRFVFGAAYDRSGEPEKNLVPDYLTDRVSTRQTRNMRADDLPSPFQLWMWSTQTGERKPVLPDGPRTLLPEPPEESEGEVEDPGDGEVAEEEPLGAPYRLRTIGWAPQPEASSPARFAFELYSQDFRRLSLWCWTEGFCEKLWEEEDPAWIGGAVRRSLWTRDGRLLVIGSEGTPHSSQPGQAQLFAVDPETLEARQLTEVGGEVTDFRPLAGGGLLVEASRDDPARREIGLVPAELLREPSGERTPPREAVHWFHVPVGFNTAAAGSRDGHRIAYRHSRLFSPEEIWTADLERSYQLTRTLPEAYEEIEWIRPRRIVVTAPDGARVHAHVFLPPGVELSGVGTTPRATIVFVHGAGYLQNVTDSMTRYPLNLLFHSRLAQMGYPVIDVDYRGSAGYGRDFRTALQYHLGGLDLEDIQLVVDELVGRGIVDPKRVGIYGGSYGGFMTMMALFTAADRWRVGAALRSVTDWRTYNPWYTQPRLGRPSTHPEAYVRSSPIDHVDGLEDPLLVLHGLVDSNVFAQDSIRLIEELIDRNKEFDAMLYPSQGHGFEDGPHWLDEYRRIERYLIQHLGPPLHDPEQP